MKSLRQKTPDILLDLVFSFFYAMMTIIVMGRAIPLNYIIGGFDVESMVLDGNTLQPFTYRVLPVLLVKLFTFITPHGVQSLLVSLMQPPAIKDFLTSKFLPQGLEFEGLMFVAVMYINLLGYIVMLFKTARSLFPKFPLAHRVAPLLGLFIITPFLFPRSYVYDFGVLFLWTACFYALITSKWKLYFLCFILAILNKETAFLLIVFYAIHFVHVLPRKRYIQLGLLQCIIYAGIRVTTLLIFHNNPGDILEFHLIDNFFDFMAQAYSFETLIIFVAAIFVLFFRWQDKPIFLRRALWLFLPLFALYNIGGCCGEWRVFYEIFPVFTLLATHTLIIGSGFERPVTSSECA